MEYNIFHSLSNKFILLTGASSGIGRETSILLSKLGAKLLLIDINQSGLLKTIEYCPNETIPLVLDLTDSETLKIKIIDLVKKHGKLDGVAHIAGKPSIVPLKSISQSSATDIFQLNTYSAIDLAKIFVNHNVFSGKSGSIVFISSVYGLVGSSANVAYASSKAALHGITKSLSIELAPKKIRVNCIAPGFIKTEMMANNKDKFNDEYINKLDKMHPLGLGEAIDISYMIAFLLSDLSKWMTGSILSLDGGFTAQ
jgi:NAD(P)-dependent dehydrogenase (short-subunit alcohol dehydrogenase family)